MGHGAGDKGQGAGCATERPLEIASGTVPPAVRSNARGDCPRKGGEDRGELGVNVGEGLGGGG
jgi:hypothetical protein